MKKLTRKLLESMVIEAIKASPSYMKKEAIRETLQQMIASKVSSGEVDSQGSLEELFKTFDMALNALKMVPYDVYAKIAQAPGVKKQKKG